MVIRSGLVRWIARQIEKASLNVSHDEQIGDSRLNHPEYLLSEYLGVRRAVLAEQGHSLVPAPEISL